MGALVGGIYAAGKLPEYREWMKTINKRRIRELLDLSLSINHLVKGERIIEKLMEIVPDVDIEDLPIPYCAVATDWASGHEVIFREGSLFQAIRASISLPTIFNPVRREGMILIDGGVTNPLPLNRVVRHEGDKLVGVDLSGYDFEGETELQREREDKRKKNRSLTKTILNKLTPDNLDFNYFTLLSRSSSIMLRRNSRLMTELIQPDLLIDIQLQGIDGFDFDKSEQLIAIGHEEARKQLLHQSWNSVV